MLGLVAADRALEVLELLRASLELGLDRFEPAVDLAQTLPRLLGFTEPLDRKSVV